MRYPALLLPAMLAACSLRPQEDKILTPVLSDGFYQTAIRQIEDRLTENTWDEDEDLILLQLNYFEKLGWPMEASRAIDRARHTLPMDPSKARKYAGFYLKHNKYFHFLEVRSALEDRYTLPDWIQKPSVEVYNNLGDHRQAKQILKQHFAVPDNAFENYWIGSQYLESQDSLAAMRYWSQFEGDADRNLLENIIPVASRYRQFDLIDHLLSENDFEALSFRTRAAYSTALYAEGKHEKAKDLLWGSADKPSLFLLSDWYKQESKWDSAHMCLDNILLSETDNPEALMKKGNLDRDRGWLSRAYMYYTQVASADSTYADVSVQIESIKQKLSYLRRIREAQINLPALDLETKRKSINP